MANQKTPATRTKTFRWEELDEVLERPLENPQGILETLLTAAGKGQHVPALFAKLHASAAAQELVAEMAFAYESLLQDRRVKLLSAEMQATVYLHAVEFFADVFGDSDGAIGYAERALAAQPGNPIAVQRLEQLLGQRGDAPRLAKLYLDLATQERDPAQQLARLRKVVEVAGDEPNLGEIMIEALTRLNKLDPSDGWVRDALEQRLVRAGKTREAVKVLEAALSREPPPSEVDEFQIRTRLLGLYTKDLGEPQRAVPHIEALLAKRPEHAEARHAAETLLENRVVSARVAAALSDAYFKLGMRDQAAAMLNLELKTVRGQRRLEVQRRLAFIKQDAGDPAGALELLGPVVSADPAEDEARRRYVELSLSLNQPAEAAKLLNRALGSCKDPALRARVGAEIGRVYLRSGDVKRADAAFKQVIQEAADAAAMLTAARHLVEMYDTAGDPKALAGGLELVVKLETDAERRTVAARRLARLAEGELNDPALAIVAWRGLIDSQWADEALKKLTVLYEEAGDYDGLIDVVEQRAARAREPGEARHLALRAAELRTSKGRDRRAALAAWRAFLARFGPTREAHAQMIPLLEQEKQWKELAWVLEREIESAPIAEWVPLLNRLAQLRASRLGDVQGALAAYRKALETDPSDKVSRAAVEKLLLAGDARLEAADILEGVYRDEEPGTGLLKVLETRAELAPDAAARLAALEEALAIAGGVLKDPARALELAGIGLALAVESDRSALGKWLERVLSFGNDAGRPKDKARALARALGDAPIDSPEMLALGRATAEALVQSGEVPAAIAVYRRALERDPASEELLARIDELLAEQGSPNERLALYASALERGAEGARRRQLLHAMARLQQSELGDPEAAVVTWQKAIADDPRDAVAHQALVDMFTQRQDHARLYDELCRALEYHEGERRNATLLQMAEISADSGDAQRALNHYRALLEGAELSDSVLENIELLAHANNDAETMRTVLERRIAVASAPEDRAQLLEKLGLVQAKQLADGEAAAQSWLAGARFAHAAGDDERARRLYERVLGVAPGEAEAARQLIELYASAGQWQRVPEAFTVLLRAGIDERDVVALLLALEKSAAEAGVTDVFSELCDATLAGKKLEPARMRQVLLSKARVLSTSPSRREQVAEIYRRVLDDGGEDLGPVADAFNLFLASGELSPARIADRRWLFEWRAARAADPTTVLIAWAVAEETTFGNPAAAIELYQRVLDRDPDRLDALHQLARLQAEHGDPEGALGTLANLRERSEGEERTSVELGMAALMLDRLERPVEALSTLEPLLDAAPDDPEVMRLVKKALGYEAARPRAALLLEKVASSAERAQRTEVLRSLLDISQGVAEMSEARGRWYRQLLEGLDDDHEAALAIALAGAEERPGEAELWDAAERLARKLERPAPVAEAYARVLAEPLEPELAEELGRRLVEFNEEWFEDPERVVGLLSRVLELCPGAEWAFDRLKLAFNAAGRWHDLFSLYDRALERAADDKQRIELLREAAMAAKDFANDSERAIGYFERLDELAPDDTRVDAALERLYERDGRTRPLITLLQRRLAKASPDAERELTLRIAALWLDLSEPVEAYALIERLIELGADAARVTALLERLVALPAARDSIVPGVEGKKGKNDSRSVRHLAAEILRKRYEAAGAIADVARMLEVELELADSKAERAERLARIIELRLGPIGDLPGAFESTAQLVALEPSVSAHREKLADLAARTDSQARRAELLVSVADAVEEPATRVALLLEAAQIQKVELGDSLAAIDLYFRVLDGQAEPTSALTAARELEGLLERAGRAAERCTVLERLADLETEPPRRRAALGTAARVAGRVLGDWERAIRAQRRRIADDPEDLEALDGLCDALAAANRWMDLIEALEARARFSDPEGARRDRVFVARLWADQVGDVDRAIATWQGIRAELGEDRESFDAMSELLARAARHAELAELTRAEAEAESDPARRRELYAKLGRIHWRDTREPARAIEAFVAAQDYRRAAEVCQSVEDRAEARALLERLLDLSTGAWVALDAPESHVDDGPGWAVSWATDELVRRLGEERDHRAVERLLLAAAERPFSTRKRRTFLRDAARLRSDQLGAALGAIELYRKLFSADATDEIAQDSVGRFAALLEEQQLHDEIAELWERQAEGRRAAGDAGTAAALFARAADIAEQRLNDIERAIRAHRAAAELGGEASLEALARIHEARGEPSEAAAVLEKLCSKASRDTLAARTLRLAAAYLATGQRDLARARLEHAAEAALDAALVRKRLAELYREENAWGPLAELLTTEAARAADVKSRLELLQEAAKIHLDKRADPVSAVPLLEQAIELEPDEPRLRLLLAQAFTHAERFDDATSVLQRQIERYGTRKPKDRALFHFHLAKVSLAAGRRAEAIAELDVANKIDPAHPGILQALARLAFDEGQLERAEKQYRALLLVLGRRDDPESPSRAEALLDLSEIAARGGDSLRASELVDSAFEAALEQPREAQALERALTSRSRYDLLARAVEARLGNAETPADAARALGDLAFLHAEHLGGLGAAEGRIRERAHTVHQDLERGNVQDDRAWAALGRVYDWLGEASAEAEVLERRVTSLAERRGADVDAEPFYRLAEIRLADRASLARGVEVLEWALERRPDLPRAARLLRLALELAPDDARLVHLFERVARAAGDDAALGDALLLLVKLPGSHPEALAEGVALARKAGDESRARELLEVALAIGREPLAPADAAWALSELSSIYEAAGEITKALDARERAAALSGPAEGRSLLLAVAARAAADGTDRPRARRIYEGLLRQDPADRDVWEPLCEVYRAMGAHAELVKLIADTVPLVEQVTDRARLRFEQATILLDQGKSHEATAILQEILEEDPSQKAAADLLLEMLERAGRKDELIALLVTQIDAAKDRQDIGAIVARSLQLGKLLEAQGRGEDAYDVYVAVLEWDKSNREILNAVLRFAELRDDSYLIADTLEALLAIERGEHAVELASRLVSLRNEQGDEAGAERALELGFVASPTTMELREPLLERYAAAEDWAGASRLLREAVRVVPDDRELLGRLVDAHRNAGESAAALEVLGALPEAVRTEPEIQRARAALLADLGRDEEALSELEAAYAVSSDCAWDLVELLERAASRAEPPRDRELALRAIEILERSGDVDGARARLAELSRLAPRDKEPLRRLAELEVRSMSWDAASTAYRRLLALEDGDALVETALALAHCCERGGRFGDARGAIERALRAAPADARIRERARSLYEAMGDYKSLAELIVEDAQAEQQVAQRHALLLQAGSLLLMPDGDPARALAVLEQAQGLAPESHEGTLLTARALAAVGRGDEALTLLTSTIAAHRGRRSRELSGVYREVSRIELAAGNLSEALAALVKAFEMDMKNARLAMELGQLALDMDDVDTAGRAFRTVTLLRPGEDDSPEGVTLELRAHAQYQLAVMAHRSGDVRRARVLAAKALSENPEHEPARQLLAELGS